MESFSSLNALKNSNVLIANSTKQKHFFQRYETFVMQAVGVFTVLKKLNWKKESTRKKQKKAVETVEAWPRNAAIADSTVSAVCTCERLIRWK